MRSKLNSLSPILVLTVLVGVPALSSPAAHAHTALVNASPAVDSVVKEWPTSITLTFDEDLQEIADQKSNSVSVNNSIAELLNGGEPVVTGASIELPVKEDNSPGLVLVSYRVVSADGHPVEGEYTFTYAPNGEVTQSTATTAVVSSKNNKNSLIYAASTVLIVFGALFGIWAYRRRKE